MIGPEFGGELAVAGGDEAIILEAESLHVNLFMGPDLAQCLYLGGFVGGHFIGGSGLRNFPACRARLIAATMLITAIAPACASAPLFVGEIVPVSNLQIAVVRVAGHIKNSGIVVDGDVRRPNGYAGVVPGHLRIEARDGAGTVLAATTADWGEFKSRRLRLAYFHAFIPVENPPLIRSISVQPETSRQPCAGYAALTKGMCKEHKPSSDKR